jgi:hypothetical protein
MLARNGSFRVYRHLGYTICTGRKTGGADNFLLDKEMDTSYLMSSNGTDALLGPLTLLPRHTPVCEMPADELGEKRLALSLPRFSHPVLASSSSVRRFIALTAHKRP